MRGLRALAAAALATVACPGPGKLAGPSAQGTSGPPAGACAGLASEGCTRAQALLGAASLFSNVKHDYILDPTSSFAPGRGLERTGSGLWESTPTACARPSRDAGASAPGRLDPTTIDFGFVGVAVDSTLVGADADLTPFFSAGASAEQHKLRLVAIAFVRDTDPQFFDADDAVSYGEERCACGRATHFIGAVKAGGMLAYEAVVRAGEVHGKALDLFKAKLAARDQAVTETRVGGLEVEGLEAALRGSGGAGSGLLTFRVKNPVPVAYSVYPLADVCKASLAAPDVSPSPVDFGDVPYGKEATRFLHVVNRAPIDLTISFRGKLFEVSARGSMDLPSRWVPEGDRLGCDPQIREDTIVFVPRDTKVPVTPKQQSVRLVEHVRAGRGQVTLRDRIDSGEGRSPDYRSTARDSACPPQYVVSACRAENAECEGKACGAGYQISASQTGAGCRFGCTGPTSWILGSHSCRFDAVTECQLSCASR